MAAHIYRAVLKVRRGAKTIGRGSDNAPSVAMCDEPQLFKLVRSLLYGELDFQERDDSISGGRNQVLEKMPDRASRLFYSPVDIKAGRHRSSATTTAYE